MGSLAEQEFTNARRNVDYIGKFACEAARREKQHGDVNANAVIGEHSFAQKQQVLDFKMRTEYNRTKQFLKRQFFKFDCHRDNPPKTLRLPIENLSEICSSG